MNNLDINIKLKKDTFLKSNFIYKQCLKYATSRYSFFILFIVAFADASCLPLPTPFIFIAMILLNIKKAYIFAIYGSIGTITGSLLGYLIGYFLWNTHDGEYTRLANFMFNYIPSFDIEFYKKIKSLYDIWGSGLLLLAPFIPIPYKIFSISSGIFGINILPFILTTAIGQSIKFFLTSFLTIKLGYKILPYINSHLKTVSFLLLIIIIIIVVFKFI